MDILNVAPSKTTTYTIEDMDNLIAGYENLPSEIDINDLDLMYKDKVKELRDLYKNKDFDFMAYIDPILLSIEIIPITNLIRIIYSPVAVGSIDLQIKDEEKVISLFASDILYIPKSFQLMFDLGLEPVAINVSINKIEKALE